MPRHDPRSAASWRDYIKKRAHALTHEAIRLGKLPNLSVEIFFCVDCGERATDWDHRDYREPLEVEQVCRGCNIRRGPALPPITEKDETEYKLDWIKGYRSRYGLGGGEGFSPLESQCHISTTEAEALSEQWDYQYCYELHKSVHLALGRDPVSIQRLRDEYFKAHDPWAVL